MLRRTAAEALGKIGDQQAVQSLVLALDDPAAIVREAAARSLGQVGPVDRVTTERLAGLLVDPIPSVRTAAAQTLASLDQGKELWPAWQSQLAHDNPDVRRAVIHALEGFDRPEVVEALSGAARDPDAGVRRAAVVALVESGDSHVGPLLRGRVSADPSSSVRAEVAYRLQFVSADADRQELSLAEGRDESLQVRRWMKQTLKGMESHGSDSAPRQVPPAGLGLSRRYP
ncbi:MAG: HEAT repeat domain-containing protein [Nitrospira sp.]|nr:HEAT repeat domain-containing protein [Nitrospira sp.]